MDAGARTLIRMTETGRSGAVGAPMWWERRRSVALDVGLAVVSAAECGLQGADFAAEVGGAAWWGVLPGVLLGALLVVRRRWPVLVVLLGIAVTPAEMGALLGLVGLYTLAASEVPRRIIVGLSGMHAVGVVIMTFVRMQQSFGQEPDDGPRAWLVWLVSVVMSVGITAPPVLLGLYAGARRRLVESLRERADGLERELVLLADRAEERAEWARNEERTRIAREMHDVVAHRVSLMVVHSAAVQAVAVQDPEQASRNAALVGDMGRQALRELRAMLGVLRTDDGAGSSAGVRSAVAGAGSVPADPAAEDGVPCLDGLDALVEQSRAAGMVVAFAAEGESRGYAPEVEQTVFRVVQEALTNAHKHAAGARVRVRLARRAGEVAVQVENGVPGSGEAPPALPSGGNGLTGMRERVASLGGVFVSGGTEAGGYRVSAVLPGDGPVATGGRAG